MHKRNKQAELTSRDLVSLGIFNAIAIVTYYGVAAIAGTTVIGLLVCSAVAYLPMGVVYMLMALKIKKRGVFLISGVVLAIIAVTGGRIYHAVGCVIGGLFAELLAGKNQYQKPGELILAYVTLAFVDFLGIYLPFFILGQEYMLSRGSTDIMTQEAVNAFLSYLTAGNFLLIALLNILGAYLGAKLGIRVVNRHFRKAGLIE